MSMQTIPRGFLPFTIGMYYSYMQLSTRGALFLCCPYVVVMLSFLFVFKRKTITGSSVAQKGDFDWSNIVVKALSQGYENMPIYINIVKIGTDKNPFFLWLLISVLCHIYLSITLPRAFTPTITLGTKYTTSSCMFRQFWYSFVTRCTDFIAKKQGTHFLRRTNTVYINDKYLFLSGSYHFSITSCNNYQKNEWLVQWLDQFRCLKRCASFLTSFGYCLRVYTIILLHLFRRNFIFLDFFWNLDEVRIRWSVKVFWCWSGLSNSFKCSDTTPLRAHFSK